jgi:hypothetical protein
MMKTVMRIICSVAVVGFLAAPAYSGVVDSPKPLFGGKAARTIYYVPNVIHNNGMETVFTCTSLDSMTIRIGIEIFDSIGGPPLNDVSDPTGNGAGDVPIGGTFTVGTDNTKVLSEDEVISGLPPNIRGGSARIVSNSKRIACSAVVIDESFSNDATCTAGLLSGACLVDSECDSSLGAGDGVCTPRGLPGGVAFPLKVISKKQRGD